MRNRIISIVFIITIFVMGGFTLSREIREHRDTAEYLKLAASIDAELPGKLPLRYELINLNGLFMRVTGRSFVEDNEADVYRMNNGQLIYGSELIPEDTVSYYSSRLYYFKEKLGRKTPLVYVQLPYKIKAGDNVMPSGVTDYANTNANALVRTNHELGVSTLDLRGILEDSAREASYYDYFYNTDQHWTNRTALWAASEISEYLAQETGLNMKAIREDSFRTEPVNIRWLGAFGRKTGKWYAGTDSYELVLPSFDTDYEFTAYKEDGTTISRSGSFEEALLDKSNLTGSIFETNVYETYTGGNYPVTKVINKKNRKGPKLLLIRDSFSCSMMPFLTTSCSSITAVDLRYLKDKTALDIARSGDYDAVVVAYNPSVYGDSAFNLY